VSVCAENCSSKPPPLPAKRVTGAGRVRAAEFRARKNGISEQKVTPDGTRASSNIRRQNGLLPISM